MTARFGLKLQQKVLVNKQRKYQVKAMDPQPVVSAGAEVAEDFGGGDRETMLVDNGRLTQSYFEQTLLTEE